MRRVKRRYGLGDKLRSSILKYADTYCSILDITGIMLQAVYFPVMVRITPPTILSESDL